MVFVLYGYYLSQVGYSPKLQPILAGSKMIVIILGHYIVPNTTKTFGVHGYVPGNAISALFTDPSVYSCSYFHFQGI